MTVTLYQAVELVTRYDHGSVDACSTYGEPGYADPKAGILFANWNNVPEHISRGLERRGFAPEWSDEWLINHDGNSEHVRTSPDSYGWKPSYGLTEDGAIYGRHYLQNRD